LLFCLSSSAAFFLASSALSAINCKYITKWLVKIVEL
jgi:hypothetical protein